jgi:hypothetical protein
MPTTDSAPQAQPAGLAGLPSAADEVEIVIPVRDEQRDLGPSVRRLRAYLDDGLPFAARITIADNGSTDGTWPLALRLANELPLVRAVRIGRAGRGGALRSAWADSDADVFAYMDVDLSTDLNALLPLIAPLVTGHSDVAIGTRLAPGARVIGGFTGSDPAPTLAEFQKMVAEHEIHYFVAGGAGGGAAGGPGGGSGYGSQITAWVEAHFTARSVGGMTVYDLTAPK